MVELSLSSQGAEVRRLQELLNNAVTEYPPLLLDGVFGQKTRSRVIAFQTQTLLLPDGVVGPKTSMALVASVLSPRMKR